MSRIVKPSAQAQMLSFDVPVHDPKTGARVVKISDLDDYLREHGLAVIRSEWKPGQERPTVYVKEAQSAD